MTIISENVRPIILSIKPTQRLHFLPMFDHGQVMKSYRNGAVVDLMKKGRYIYRGAYRPVLLTPFHENHH